MCRLPLSKYKPNTQLPRKMRFSRLTTVMKLMYKTGSHR